MENGSYLFVVYDCNDEVRMKVVKRYRDFLENAADIDERANWLLRDTEGLEETAWLEVFKLVGRRVK